MFSKFFTFGSKSDGRDNQPEPPPLPHSCSWEPVAFDSSQLRVILLKESKSQGRQVLFDSLAWDRQNRRVSGASRATPEPDEKRRSSTESLSSNKGHHIRLKRLGDTEMLAEMMFGSVAIVSRGATVKLHRLRDPPRLLVTKVFSLQRRQGTSIMSPINPSLPDATQSLPVNLKPFSPYTSQTQSLPSSPQDIPGQLPSWSSQFDQNADSVMSASPGGVFMSPTGSFLTRQRRSLVVSLEFATARQSQDELFSPVVGKRGKLAVGVIVTLPSGLTEEVKRNRRLLLDFFFSHFPLVESHIEQLRENIEAVLENPQRNVLEQCAEVVHFFKSVIVNLCQSLRLHSPIWLSLMKSTVSRNTTCKRLIDMLSHAVTHYNIPTKKRFLTGLLTAVLSYHLGWVSTVVPSQSNPHNSYLNKHASDSYTTLAQSHPYDPLWAQLADLYGAIGSPPHIAHTVIVGRKGSIVYQLLYILSYFIRCTHVTEFNSSLESYWHLNEPETDSIIASPGETPSEKDFQNELSASVAIPRCRGLDDRLKSPDDTYRFPYEERKIPDESLYQPKPVANSMSSPEIGVLNNDESVMSPSCSSQSLMAELADKTKPLDVKEKKNKESIFSLDSGLGTEENGVMMKHQPKETDGDVRMGCSMSALAQSLKETEMMGTDFSVDIQLAERFSELERVVLPRYSQSEETEECESYSPLVSCPRSLSESLFGGYTSQYNSDFVLQGTAEGLTDFMPRLSQDLQLQVNYPGIDDFIDEAVCIVADTEQWTCDVVSLTNQRQDPRHKRRVPRVNIVRARKSALVQSLLDTLQEMHQHSMPDEFCLMQLEDKLQEIYFKSRVLSEHYKSSPDEIAELKLASAAGVDISDLPLLQSVAQTSPSFPHHADIR